MTQWIIHFTNKKVSRKTAAFCLHVTNVQRLSHWGMAKHASFIHLTPPPSGAHRRCCHSPFLMKEPLHCYVLQHMGPPLSYMPCSLASKARPLSRLSFNPAFKKWLMYPVIYFCSFFFSSINVHTVYIVCIQFIIFILLILRITLGT